MIPVTTPTFTLTTGEADLLADAVELRVDFQQNGNTVQLFLSDGDLTVEDDTVKFTLTQTQTQNFRAGKARVQLHGLSSDQTAWKTEIATVTISETLTRDVISSG